MTDVTTIDTPLQDAWSGRRRPRSSPTALDLHTVGDLIYHFPRRYDERGELTDIARLDVGEQVTVLAQVRRAARPADARPPGQPCWRWSSATAPAAS